MSKRVSVFITILKPFVILYRIIVPKGGHRGFAYFTGCLTSMFIALSVFGSFLAKRNVSNSFNAIADAQNTTEIEKEDSVEEQEIVMTKEPEEIISSDEIQNNEIQSNEVLSNEEQDVVEQDNELVDNDINKELVVEGAEDEESLYLFTSAPDTSDASDNLMPLSVEDTGSNYIKVNDCNNFWYDMFEVDMDVLTDINPEIIGWIVWENEDISYPLLYSGDNTKYLDTSFSGETLNSGAIFLDGRNSDNFDNQHNIVYGHNMKNLSMFGKLRYYKTEDDYYEDHQYLQIILPDRIERYEIFAFNTVSENSMVYSVEYDNNEEYQNFIDYVSLASYTDTGIEAYDSDKILTLSTCTSNEDLRFVVHALKVDEYEIEK